jgi:hypothetical protein
MGVSLFRVAAVAALLHVPYLTSRAILSWRRRRRRRRRKKVFVY